jgi:hypothetical protein
MSRCKSEILRSSISMLQIAVGISLSTLMPAFIKYMRGKRLCRSAFLH